MGLSYNNFWVDVSKYFSPTGIPVALIGAGENGTLDYQGTSFGVAVLN